MTPRLGDIVLYRTDGRNGLVYDLPAIVTCAYDTHPGDYPDGRANPLPVPPDPMSVHLTVFTPGGFGTQINRSGTGDGVPENDEEFIGAQALVPGSGTYVEWSVYPDTSDGTDPQPRSWRPLSV